MPSRSFIANCLEQIDLQPEQARYLCEVLFGGACRFGHSPSPMFGEGDFASLQKFCQQKTCINLQNSDIR